MGTMFDKMFDNEEIRSKVKEIIIEEINNDDEFRAELRRAIFK